MRMRCRTIAIAGVLAAVVGFAPGASRAAQEPEGKIGVASAATILATGTPPRQAERIIEIGTDMVAEERVVTSASGRVQLLFLDGSALTVGPNSDIRLDEYVYDPKTKTGKVAFSTAQGVFRFVGGKISKSAPVEFRTPVATIGVRGGISDLTATPEKTTAIKHFGQDLTVALKDPDGRSGKTETIRVNGTKLEATAGSGAVQLSPVTKADLSATNASVHGTPGAAVAGSPGGPGGSETPNDQNTAQRTQIVSAAHQTSVASQPVDQPPPAPFLPAVAATSTAETVEQTAEVAQNQQEQTTAAATPPAAPPPPPPGPGYAGQYHSNARNAQGQGGAPQDFAQFTFVPGVSTAPPIPSNNIRFSGGMVSGGMFTASLNGAPLALPVGGPGFFNFGPIGTQAPFGPVSGEAFFAPDQSFLAYRLFEGDDSNAPSTVFAGLPFSGARALADPLRTADFPTDDFAAHAYVFGLPLPQSVLGQQFQAPMTLFSRFAPTIGGAALFESNERAVAMLAGLHVNLPAGHIATQNGFQASSFFVGTGAWLRAREVQGGLREGPIELGANAFGTVRQQGNDTGARFNFSLTSAETPDGHSVFGTTGPDYFATSSEEITRPAPDLRSTNQAAFRQPLDVPLGTPNGGAEPFFTNGVALRAELPEGLGERRETTVLRGYVGGIANVRAAGVLSDYVFNSAPTENSLTEQASMTISTDAATNRAQATIRTANVYGPGYTINRFELGDLAGVGINSAYIDADIFALRETFNRPPGTLLQGSEASQPITRLSAGLATWSGISATPAAEAAVDVGSPFFCECRYLNWGFWSADASAGTPGTPSFRRELIHAGGFVAGEIPATIDIPLAGVAVHKGHMVGSVKNGGFNTYLASGNFIHTFDFGRRNYSDAGTFVANFDSTTYAGFTSGAGMPADFRSTNPLPGTVGDRTMSLKGSFFKGPASPVQHIGGSFSITGTTPAPYAAGGVFAGEKIAGP